MTAAAAPAGATNRFLSLDVMRGLVMVLMAIDHVRVYSGIPAGGPSPEGYRWSLALLYLVFVIVVATLYVPCRWFARLKARRHSEGWLRYL